MDESFSPAERNRPPDEPRNEDAGDAPPHNSGPDHTALSRIAQTGRRVRAETRRLLSQEGAPRKRAASRKRLPLPKTDLAATLSSEEKSRLIEVTDRDDRPLLCMPPEAAQKSRLCYRLVSLALRTRDNRLYLHKGKDPRLGQQDHWDLYTDFVMVGEARKDAALRLIEQAGLHGLVPRLLAEARASEDSQAHLSFFAAEVPPGMYPAPLGAENAAQSPSGPLAQEDVHLEAARELLEVDNDELSGLTERAPELFTPGLLFALRAGFLFKRPNGQ